MSYEIGELSTTNELGMITCNPKQDKPNYFRKICVPLLLITVVYKIATGCIAKRIKKFLEKLISNDQTGLIKGSLFGKLSDLYMILLTTLKINKYQV